jgi:hypothetical protein
METVETVSIGTRPHFHRAEASVLKKKNDERGSSEAAVSAFINTVASAR